MDNMEYYGISRVEKRPHLWELRVGMATHLAISGPRRKFHRICHFVIINGTFLLF